MADETHAGTMRGVARTVVTLLSLPLAWLFVALTADYYAACDIGINAAANSFFLVLIVLPAALVAFALVGFVVFGVAAGRLGLHWAGAAAVALFVLVLAFGAGQMAVRADAADYPGPCNAAARQNGGVR